MAINTDADFQKSNLGEGGGGAQPADSQETEKLLAVTTEPGGNGMKMSSSFTVNMGGDKGLEADQNGHSVALRSGSVGQLAAAAPPLPVQGQPEPLLHRERYRPGDPEAQGLPHPGHLLLLLPRVARQHRRTSVLHHVQKQSPGGGHGRGQEAGSTGSSAQYRLHHPGRAHHRSLRLSFSNPKTMRT
ncbi:tumor suppressor candidate 5 homolog [Lates japonicus]